MQPDKFKRIVEKQNLPPRPPTLGEPCETTNWDEHIDAGHKIKHFVKIQDLPNKQKEAVVHTPEDNKYFIATKEMFGDKGYYYVWILCLTHGSARINWRVNTGDIHFVLWDVPEGAAKTEEVKAE